MDSLDPAHSVRGEFGQGCRVGLGLALCGLLLTACAAVDTPDACRLTHVADIPIRLLNNLQVVAVQVGGKPLRLVLDTGAEGVIVTPAAVERLGLDRDYSQFGYAIGLGAQASYWPIKPVAIQLGSVIVEPKSLAVGTVMTSRGGNAPDGLLGGVILSVYDLDVDIAQRRLALYQRRSCPSGPAPFPGPSLSVQAGRVGALRMAVPVSLDGKMLSMLVDTGANRSMVDPAALGVSDDDMQSDRAGHMNTADPVGLNFHLHTFKQLALSSDVVDNPVLAVGRLNQPGYSGLLGTDYWRSHRLWMSYGSGTLFVGMPPPRQSRP